MTTKTNVCLQNHLKIVDLIFSCLTPRYAFTLRTSSLFPNAMKRSTGSYMSCSVRITVRVQAVPELDKNKAQIYCSERTSGNRIMLDRPFKLHQSYRPLPRFIQEINPAAKSGYQL